MDEIVTVVGKVMQRNHDGSLDIRVSVFRESMLLRDVGDVSVESLPIMTLSREEIDNAPLQPAQA